MVKVLAFVCIDGNTACCICVLNYQKDVFCLVVFGGCLFIFVLNLPHKKKTNDTTTKNTHTHTTNKTRNTNIQTDKKTNKNNNHHKTRKQMNQHTSKYTTNKKHVVFVRNILVLKAIRLVQFCVSCLKEKLVLFGCSVWLLGSFLNALRKQKHTCRKQARIISAHTTNQTT